MEKTELLIPCGSYECLEAAVYNGADAVYLAGKSFGARKFANNFDNEELLKGIKLAHLYGVNVYVTVNTIVYENEINDFVNYIDFLYSANVDALIMQDLGMISLVHEKYPDFEIHASTQMHNISKYNTKYLESLGIKRVVFARELSLDEIKKIDTSLEKEIFIHGALCVSYSGECLFSSLVGGRSGNRGECAGSCRLPYSLYQDDKVIRTNGVYLLSTRELNSLNNLKEILDSGTYSLKIEGRMKGKTYVGFITRLYRRLIDEYYEKHTVTVTNDDIKKLKSIFNREFTDGYLFNKRNKEIVNINTPNHQGILIGKVLSIKDKIKVLLSEDLYQNDGIRFSLEKGMIVNFLYDDKMKLTSCVKKGNICYLDNKIGLEELSEVYKTIDSNLVKEVDEYEKKKIGVKLFVKAKNNEQLIIQYDDVSQKGGIVQASINRPTTEEDLKRSLSKLGNTPFYVEEFNIECDENIFVSVSELNDLRRRAIELLIEKKSNRYDRSDLGSIKRKSLTTKLTNDISVLVRNEETLKIVLNKSVTNIYVTDYDLYNKYKSDKRVFYRVPRVYSDLKEFKDERLLISDLGSLYKYKDNNYTVSDAYLNIVNSYSVNKLLSDGVKKVTLSYEMDLETIRSLMLVYKAKIKSVPNVEVSIYGKPELMIMKYCPLNTLLCKDGKCNICKNGHKYYLNDRMNKKYLLLQDNCINYVMHYKNIDLLEKIDELKKCGVTNFRIDLLNESEKEIDELLSYLEN